jgi:hypothetical protein
MTTIFIHDVVTVCWIGGGQQGNLVITSILDRYTFQAKALYAWPEERTAPWTV